MLQLPLFTPESDWRPPSLSDLPSWKGAKRIAFDTETRDDHLKQLGPGVRRGGYMVGYSFSIEDGPAHYVPIRHLQGDNLDEKNSLAYLREQAKHFDGEIVGANLPYDIDYAGAEGVEFKSVKRFRDVQIADPLIYELHRSYSLQSIAERFGFPGKDVALLEKAAKAYGVSPKGGMWKLPARFVGKYATQDTVLPLQILRRQERIIDEEDLWEVYNLESDLLPVLVKMRQRGVAIDEQRLEQIESWSLREEKEALEAVRHTAGVSVAVGDVWKPGALLPIFERLGISLPQTTKGKPSIKKDILNEIDHPAIRALQRARKVNKLRTTFAASIRTYETQGRIHCTFNQLRRTDDDTDEEKGAAYGRLSCEDPNMQQQPARDEEIGPMWRSIYRPDKGKTWASLDFSQQEPKWLIHWATKTPAKYITSEAREAAEAAALDFRNNPNMDTYDAFAKFAEMARKAVKEVYLGRVYGMGTGKMSRKLGKPTKMIELRSGRLLEVAGPEGQAIIDKFDGGVPYAAKMAQYLEKLAKERGFIRTYSGRRCRFPRKEFGEGFDWTHKALNRLIQGSSADQVKKTMVEIDRAGFEMSLQVHDELNFSAASPEEAQAVATIMREAVPLSVPMKVDVELGDSWGASMGFKWNL